MTCQQLLLKFGRKLDGGMIFATSKKFKTNFAFAKMIKQIKGFYPNGPLRFQINSKWDTCFYNKKIINIQNYSRTFLIIPLYSN